MRGSLVFASALFLCALTALSSGCNNPAAAHSSSGNSLVPTPNPTTTSTPPPTQAPTPPTYSSIVLSDAPVGYWNLNDASGSTFADTASGASTGTLMGQVTFQNTSGGTGAPSSMAIQFDGNGAIVIPSSSPVSQLNNGIVTVEAWINTTENDGNYLMIFSTWEADDWNGNQVFVQGGYAGLWSGPVYNLLNGTHFVADGHWHQIVGVWNGSTTSLYVDGVLDQSASMPFEASYAQSQIGAQCWGEGSTRCDSFFVGEMQNVSVYPQALSATDIAHHYSAGQ